MNAQSSYVISEFQNPSGEIVYRVSGWLDGKRYRKNFSTRPDAETERQVLEVCHLQRQAGIHAAATRLTDEQLREAETLVHCVSDQPHPLSFYFEYARANYREPQRQQSLAVTSYVSQGKTVDTVLFADAASRAATNRNQWYVAISRGRKRVVVFTPDKEALRATIEQSGDRGLALEMKPAAPVMTPAVGQFPGIAPQSRRAWETVERVRRHDAFMQTTIRQQVRVKLS